LFIAGAEQQREDIGSLIQVGLLAAAGDLCVQQLVGPPKSAL
jgi:hypothetical protein